MLHIPDVSMTYVKIYLFSGVYHLWPKFKKLGIGAKILQFYLYCPRSGGGGVNVLTFKLIGVSCQEECVLQHIKTGQHHKHSLHLS